MLMCQKGCGYQNSVQHFQWQLVEVNRNSRLYKRES